MSRRKAVQNQAKKHHQNHKELKYKIDRYRPIKENWFPFFLLTFVVTLFSLYIINQSDRLLSIVYNSDPKPILVTDEEPENPAIKTNGGRIGMESNYLANELLKNSKSEPDPITISGYLKGVKANQALGKKRESSVNQNIILGSIWNHYFLGSGQNLTHFNQNKTQLLQKSILSTYYLGRKTIDLKSSIQNDSQLLSQIRNILSVDLFQFLNQSTNRADGLDEFLRLLKNSLSKTDKRIEELSSTINFLDDQSNSQNNQINLSEDRFFENLSIFDGQDAEEELSRFIGLRKTDAEIKAKLGAYNELRAYYQFFKPKLESLINEINLNRDALIAGVKVTEIQNMQLPLIIR